VSSEEGAWVLAVADNRTPADRAQVVWRSAQAEVRKGTGAVRASVVFVHSLLQTQIVLLLSQSSALPKVPHTSHTAAPAESASDSYRTKAALAVGGKLSHTGQSAHNSPDLWLASVLTCLREC
jgi:hypothetical protein